MLLAFLKYLSQLLLAAAGIMGIWLDSYKTTPSGKKRPSASGWVTITAIIIGLILFVATDTQERKETKKKDDDQRKQITILEEMYFKEDISGVEISFKPTAEHWARIAEAYNNTAPTGTVRTYADTQMIAERVGDHWKINFDDINLTEGLTHFNQVDTSRPNGRGFDGVLRQAAIDLWIRWGGNVVTEVRPAAGDRYPPILTVSQDRISLTLRPKVSLGSLRANPSITFRGNNYPVSVSVRSLDPRATFDQTFDLKWTEQDDGSFEARIFRYISGPHLLNIKFKTDPPSG